MVCGGRAETGSLVFVNKNGERQGGEPAVEASSCPPPSPHFSLSGGLGARRWGLAVRCLLMCPAFLIWGTTELEEGMAMGSTAWWPGEEEGWGPRACCPRRLGNPVQLSTERLPTFTGMSGPGNQSVP